MIYEFPDKLVPAYTYPIIIPSSEASGFQWQRLVFAYAFVNTAVDGATWGKLNTVFIEGTFIPPTPSYSLYLLSKGL